MNQIDRLSLHVPNGTVQSKDLQMTDNSRPARLFDNLENEEWLNAQQAAKYLKVSVSSLFNMTSNGTVPCFKLGRRNRYSLEDLRNLLTPKGKGGLDGNKV